MLQIHHGAIFLTFDPALVSRWPQAERASEPVNRNLGAFREVVHFAAMRTVTEDKFGNCFGAANDLLLGFVYGLSFGPDNWSMTFLPICC